jgi:hypothetical protein
LGTKIESENYRSNCDPEITKPMASFKYTSRIEFLSVIACPKNVMCKKFLWLIGAEN